MKSQSELTTLDIKDISVLLKREIITIYEDLKCRPQSVPLSLKIPGSNWLLWLETDVIKWFEICRQKPVGGVRSR